MKRKPKLPNKGYKVAKRTYSKQSTSRKNNGDRVLSSKSKVITKKESHSCKACSGSSYYHPRTDEGPENYAIYCIVNTGFLTNRGNLASSVARGLLKLYNKVDKNRVKAKALDNWEDYGEKLVLLDGVNHKHLVYLADELAYAAVETHALYKTWGKSRIILVLSAIGREEYLEEPLDGLSYLR